METGLFHHFLFVSIFCSSWCEAKNLTDLYLIGLFSSNGPKTVGKAMMTATDMAVDDINNRTDILPGYRLNLNATITECISGLGIKIVAEQVSNPPPKIMLIGPDCSTVSQAVAQTAYFWNLIQISYASSSPALSDKKKYPNFFRVVSSETVLNKARMALLKHFNWRRVATLYEDHHVFSMMIEYLTERLKKENYTIVTQVGFSNDPETAIQRLKDADARIIVAGFYANIAKRVFCSAYRKGFYGKQVWIIAGSSDLEYRSLKYSNENSQCTAAQIETVIQRSLVVDNLFTNMNETEEGLTGMSVARFKEIFRERRKNTTMPCEDYIPVGYDIVWAAAIALNKTMNRLKELGSRKTLADFSYEDKFMSDVIKRQLQDVSFTSVSGKTAFDQNGDGVRLTGVYQVKGFDLVRVGIYDNNKPEGSKLNIDDIWKGSIPKDGIQTRTVVITLSGHTYIIMTSLAGLGVILALLFLAFNIRFRKVRVIQISSPNINNIILLGCIMAYTSVFIADTRVIRDSTYCKIKNYLLLLAFSLSFGALFAKTWRVYTIVTATRHFKKLKARTIKDEGLFLMILCLVCLNSIVLGIWFVVDPQTIISRHVLYKKEKKNDVEVKYVNNYCWSVYQNYFLLAILLIQGIFLLLGVFLAWETRKVKLTILNESRYIGMCIYNIVVLGIVGVLVSYSVTQNISFLYIIISSITILCTTVTQCLLFVPKVLAYRKYTDRNLQDDPSSIGCTTEGFNIGLTQDKECQTDISDFLVYRGGIQTDEQDGRPSVSCVTE